MIVPKSLQLFGIPLEVERGVVDDFLDDEEGTGLAHAGPAEQLVPVQAAPGSLGS
jgi:hypothetical protein